MVRFVINFETIYYQILGLSIYSRHGGSTELFIYKPVKVITIFAGLTAVIMLSLMIVGLSMHPATRLETLDVFLSGRVETLFVTSLINSAVDVVVACVLYSTALVTQDDCLRIANRMNRIKSILPKAVSVKIDQFHTFIFALLLSFNLLLILLIVPYLDSSIIWQLIYLAIIYLTEIICIRILSSLQNIFATLSALKRHLANKSAISIKNLHWVIQDIAEAIHIFNRSNQFAILFLCCRLLVTNVSFAYANCYIVSLRIFEIYSFTFVTNIVAVIVLNVKVLIITYLSEEVIVKFQEIIQSSGGLKTNSDKQPIYCLSHQHTTFNSFGLFKLDREFAFMVRIVIFNLCTFFI